MTRSGILHIATFLQGGAGRAVCDLALGQYMSGHRVTVVTSRTGVSGHENSPDYLARLRASGVQLLQIDSTSTRDFSANLAVVRTVRDRLDLGTVDLIHAHAGTPALIGLVLASRAPRRIPVVQTVHGSGSNEASGQSSRDLAVMRELDAVVTTSFASARWLQTQGVAERLLTIIPWGLDPKLPAGDPAHRFPDVDAAREAGTKILACIGSITPQDRQALLIEALAALRPRLDWPVLAVFVGDGPAVPALEARARELLVGEQCWFLRGRPDTALLLELADALVLPSRSDNQGLTVLEAFRAGVPAVVSDTPALLELVQDRMTGYVFQGDSPDALSDRIERALTSPQRERDVIAAQAHARFMSRFTQRAMLEAHADLYARVTAHARQPGASSQRATA